MYPGELFAIIFGGGATAALVSGIIQIIIWKMNHSAKKQDDETSAEKNIKTAVRVILYDRIKYLGRRHIGEGSITAEDLEDLMNMHEVYHDNLDGNGFLDNIMKQVKALPIRR